MITAGIDVGLEYTKVVILKDGEIIARAIGQSGGVDRAELVNLAWEEALASAGLSADEIDRAIATGQGKFDAKFAERKAVEPVVAARAARRLYPQATSVVDIGADQVRVVTLGEGDKIKEVVLNQKCAAGIGIFMKYIARRLEMTPGEFSAAALEGNDEAKVSDGCVVFAELDALSLLNRRYSRQDVARAVTDAMAVRMNSVLNDKVVPDKQTTVLVGGLARNEALVGALKKRSGIDFLMPDGVEYIGALGAAMMAAEL